MTYAPINKKYSTIIKRFLSWDAKYIAIVDATEDNGGLKQERAYDKASELFSEIPKREQKHLGKFYDVIGY
jgi:hypothetical protein